MAEIKSEITLKFNELPSAEPAENKKMLVKITDTNGIVFTALLNKKSWNKAAQQVEEWESWAGAISGKLGIEGDDFIVKDAGIKVFEKKPKEAKVDDVA